MVPVYLQALGNVDSLKNTAPARDGFVDSMLRIARRVCIPPDPVPAQSSQAFSTAKVRHQQTAMLAAEIIEDSLDGLVSVKGIARALDVSERTLLTAFSIAIRNDTA